MTWETNSDVISAISGYGRTGLSTSSVAVWNSRVRKRADSHENDHSAAVSAEGEALLRIHFAVGLYESAPRPDRLPATAHVPVFDLRGEHVGLAIDEPNVQ